MVRGMTSIAAPARCHVVYAGARPGAGVFAGPGPRRQREAPAPRERRAGDSLSLRERWTAPSRPRWLPRWRLFAIQFRQELDCRTPIEQVLDTPGHFFHVVGLAMVIERRLILVHLVPYEQRRIVIRLVQNVRLATRLGRANLLDHVVEGFFQLSF